MNRRDYNKPAKLNKGVDSSKYIKIEEDVSNSKNNYSGKKSQSKNQQITSEITVSFDSNLSNSYSDINQHQSTCHNKKIDVLN